MSNPEAPRELCCRLLPYEAADGPRNMALDEALLELVAEGAGSEPAYLRIYGWSVPTLSLGYFQSLREARSEARWSTVPVVRRPTGGGAIWHEHEVTYAVVLPAIHPLARSREDLYCAVHGAISSVLVRLGAAASPAHADLGLKKNERRRRFLCFTDRNPHDIVIGGYKVLGSAQRRRAGAVLQHGSLLLDRSDRTPELLGVRNVAGTTPGAQEWSEQLLEEIPAALKLTPIKVPVSSALNARAEALAESIYRASGWTARRP
jgi:lipoate-protein ligase A